MNRGRSNCRAEGSEHAPEGSIKAPKMRRQEGDSAGAGRNAGDRAEKPAATNRRPRIRPSSTLKQKPPKNPPPLPCRLLHRRLQPRLLLIRHRWWRRLSRRRKFPPLPCRLLHKRLPNRLLLIRHRWWRRLSRRRKFPPLPCRLLHKRLPNRLLLIRHRRLLLCRWLKAQRNLTCPKRSIRRLCWMGHLP